MAYTLDQLTTLEAAIAEGTLRVKYADKEVQYRSLDEMLRIRELMRRDVGQSSGGGRVYLAYDKGT